MIKSLENELSEKLELKVVNFRNRFARLFLLRYMEMLPQLIVYKHGYNTSIDFLKLEIGLRDNLDIAIGKAKNGEIMILGYVTSNNTLSEPKNFFTHYTNTLTKKDIIPIVGKDLLPDKLEEITLKDNAQTGNFIIVRNKALNYINDREIIDHYTMQLAELVASRFSVTIQAKVITFLKGQIGDETINQIAEELYNGSPYSKVSDYFDPNDQIIKLDNATIAGNLTELKREYQNVIGELNSMLGINSVGVDKTSGVSDIEALSNKSYLTGNANIYLSPRQDAFNLLNKRYDTEIEVVYNDQIASEMQKLEIIKDVIVHE